MIVIASLTLLTFYVVMTGIEYHRNPIMTSISIDHNGGVQFPAVYVCPGMSVDWAKVDPCTQERMEELINGTVGMEVVF